MGKRTAISVEEAATIMGKDPWYIRWGLQNKELPFGSSVKKPNGRCSYHIVPRAFCEHMRISEIEMYEWVDLIREGEKEKCKELIRGKC